MTHCRCQEKEKLFKNKYKNSARVHKDESTEYYTIHLSHKLKSDILINNIFGVDIDAQAVLVTKFSLSIKALEDSTHDEVIEDNTLFKMPTIPKLENNIKCGNSLIGSDFYIDNRPSLFNEKEKRKINTFDWDKEFPQVFNEKSKEKIISKKIDTHFNAAVNYLEGAQYHTEKAIEYAVELNNLSVKEDTPEYSSGYYSGFDVVIGNPPYVLYQDEIRNESLLSYFKSNFECASYKIDAYHLFIEKSIKLCNYNGIVGLITPSNYFTNNYLKSLRKFIIERTRILKLINIHGKVFKSASVDTSISIYQSPFISNNLISYDDYQLINDNFIPVSKIVFNQELLNNNQDYLFKSKSEVNNFLDFTSKNTIFLESIASVNFGMQLRDRKIFVDDVIEIKYDYDKKRLTKKHVKCITGKDIERYFTSNVERYCLEDFTARRGGCWDLTQHHHKGKIIVRQIGKTPIFSLDKEGRNCLNTLFMIIPKHSINNLFLMGILNSKLIKYFWKIKYFDGRSTFPKIKGSYLQKIPIPLIDFNVKSQKQAHDRLVKLVEQMMENQEYLHGARNESDKKMYKNITDQLDRQIDEIVYKLYDLTEDEIRIVEEGAI